MHVALQIIDIPRDSSLPRPSNGVGTGPATLQYNRQHVRPRPCKAGLGPLLAALAALGSASPSFGEPVELERAIRRFVEVYELLDRNLAEAFDPAAAICGGALPARGRDGRISRCDGPTFPTYSR